VVAVVVDEKDQSSWSAAFHQLEMQLDRASFDTWCRGAVLRQVERPTSPQPPSAPVFVVGVRNIYARDMLQHRLYRNVRRVLSDCSGEAVELRFEVNTPTATPLPPGDDESGGVPPFRLLADQQPAMTQEGETIRTLFARFIGPVTEKNEASVKLLETQYSPETFGYALSVMAEKQAAGRVKDALSYTQGILRKLK
jgi:chromosomal replication initiation ATPase DnaA